VLEAFQPRGQCAENSKNAAQDGENDISSVEKHGVLVGALKLTGEDMENASGLENWG
jgi:hypothetical protein